MKPFAPPPVFRFQPANGLEFGLLEAGPVDGPLVLCLHGFPDSALSFQPLIQGLAAEGYRAVAVAMRGYQPTSLPTDGDYSAVALARDAIALIDHLGAKQAVLVGHDWGAVATYLAAALRPDRVRGVVTAAIPHLRRFLLRPTAAQLWRSRYMLKFQWPGTESRLLAEQLRPLQALSRDWSPGLETVAALAPVWAGFAERSRLTAALSYYRALPAALLSSEIWQLVLAPTPVPACVIHGQDDGCVAAEMFAGQSHLFAAGLQEVAIAGAGHFMHLEQPQRFNAAVLDFLRQLSG
ncbi:alpha/beta hydrolase [Stagnimonas aquatica]|uniref:Alpha/beta hydrolase n=1 Tax=Stagnimonas aquatica TaxID=2689987 RepID=A0A3N0VGL7_9GAMM|nr:alpha/beta hydrolase [Stagnimonas aquatica]ROH91917.1 alpha/beta hydrolase [Stagnimonas aquatica]